MTAQQQTSIFDFILPKYKVKKPIRLIELFAGYGSQFLSLKYLGAKVDSYKIVEWNANSFKAFNDLHFQDKTDYSENFTIEYLAGFIAENGVTTDDKKSLDYKGALRRGEKWLRETYNNIVATHNLVDITKVKGERLEIIEKDKYEYIMTYSFPCFTADTMVLTENGNKPIIDVRIGEKVLTHNNTYQKVMANMYQGEKEIYKINSYATPNLKTTENHKFYVRELYREWDNSIRRYVRKFSEPKWVELRHITKQHYFGIAINQENNHDIHSNEFWWVMGRYIADGWKRTQGGIVIATNESKLGLLQEKIKKAGYNYNTVKQRTTYKVHIPTKELSEFVSQFGYYAHGKHLSKQVLDLPIEKLEHFIEGYLSGDGSKIGDYYKASSVSEQLIYDLGQVVAKVYRQPYRIYKTKRAETSIIEGRTVKQKDTYQIVFKKETKKQDKAFYENGYIWLPFNTIEKVGVEKVYDLTVKNDHSFMANGIIAHNCQDLSLAGKGKGMGEGTRSGLLWQVERILSELAYRKELPQVLLMENVPMVVSPKYRDDLARWDAHLTSLGYSSYIKNLIATDYGIPQIRNRTFMISILGDYNYTFPKPIPLELKLSDMLEYDVDEKYYLSNKMISAFSAHHEKYPRKERFIQALKNPNENNVANTITTRAGQRPTDNFIIDEKNDRAVVKDTRNLKEKLCDELIEGGMLKGGEVINHSYTNSGKNPNSRLTLEDFIETTDGTLPTLTTRGDTLGVVVREEYQGMYQYSKSDKFMQGKDRFTKNKKFADTILTTQKEGVVVKNTATNTRDLRIRKLTPKECFRLMGVKDDDYDKIAKNQSNSSLYHLAGDSIVVNVLMAIFEQLL